MISDGRVARPADGAGATQLQNSGGSSGFATTRSRPGSGGSVNAAQYCSTRLRPTSRKRERLVASSSYSALLSLDISSGCLV